MLVSNLWTEIVKTARALTAYHLLIRRGESPVDVVKLVLASTDVNAQDEFGIFALHVGIDTEAKHATRLTDDRDADAPPHHL